MSQVKESDFSEEIEFEEGVKKEEIGNLVEDRYRNLKMELKLISYIVRKDASVCSQVISSFFTVDYYKRFFEIVLKKYKTFEIQSFKRAVYKVIDEDEKEDADIYIQKVFTSRIKSLTEEKVHHIISDLKELYESRDFMLSVADIVEESGSDKFSVLDAKERIRKSLLLDTGSFTKEQGDYLEDFEQRKEKIINRMENPEENFGLKFGIKELDTMTGGIMDSEVAVVIAPPGFGKTVFLQNAALNFWLQKENVVFFSLEMPKHEIGYRMDSRLARIDFLKFRKASLSDKELQRYDRAMSLYKEKMSDNFLEVVCPLGGCSMRDIRELCNRIQDQKGQRIGAVIIDYLTLVEPDESFGKYGQDLSRIKNVSWGMKSFAANFNDGIKVVSAGQVTDDFNHKNPQLKNIKYGRIIGENAQMVFSLARTPEDEMEGVIKIHFPKMRNAPKVDPIKLYPKLDKMTMDGSMMDIERNILGISKK